MRAPLPIKCAFRLTNFRADSASIDCLGRGLIVWIVFEVARDAITVNVSDRLREALERLDQAIDRLDAAGAGDKAVAAPGQGAASNAAIAARLDKMIQRIEAALAD